MNKQLFFSLALLMSISTLSAMHQQEVAVISQPREDHIAFFAQLSNSRTPAKPTFNEDALKLARQMRDAQDRLSELGCADIAYVHQNFKTSLNELKRSRIQFFQKHFQIANQ